MSWCVLSPLKFLSLSFKSPCIIFWFSFEVMMWWSMMHFKAYIYGPRNKTSIFKYYYISLQFLRNFTFSCYVWLKLLFLWSNFQNWVFMLLHILRPSESENRIFSGWSVVCVYVRLCYQHNSKTNYCRNSKFGFLHLHCM